MIHRHALVGLALIGALAVLPACASKKKSSSTSADSAGESSGEKGYYEEEYEDGRFYVFGQETTHESWKQNGHMPYTRTQIGSGPYGATVVYEIDKDWPALTDWLQQKFEYEHWNPEPPYYAATHHDGRIYVFGSAATEASFAEHGHMPYTRTQIGAGPNGETVVFEIDKKDPAMTDWLERELSRRGAPAAPFYAETVKDGRFYVFGSAETEASFEKHGHMPYTRTLIGAGPGGKTVVLEVDKEDESLADRLQAEFDRRHGLN